MKIEQNDFVELEFDLYANGKLVQTTNEKKGKEAGLNAKEYGVQTIIVGKEFILKALDEDLLENQEPQKEKSLELKAKDAYGLRDKKMIKVLPKSAFEEHKTRPVVGMVYDFNGMYGTVKSIIGGRVMVDFNNPLAGKDIKISYKVLKKIEDVKIKVEKVMELVLKIPQNMYSAEVKEKELLLNIPEQLEQIKEMLKQSLTEYVPELKDYSIRIEKFKKQ
jgi:FKBP-type peptidyl-prolyl cis-trans isomerase 2